MSEELFRWVITAAVCLAVLFIIGQALAVILLYVKIKQVQGKVLGLMQRAEPIVDSVRRIVDENTPKVNTMTTDVQGVVKNVRGLISDNSPKVSAMTTDVQHMVKNVREQVVHISELVKDVTSRARTQVERVDKTLEETVEQVQTAGGAVKSAVLKPVREMGGFLSGLKRGISVYTQGRRASVDHATQDEEMFI